MVFVTDTVQEDTFFKFNHLVHIKPQSNGHYTASVIGTLALNGWVVTFGTARRGLGGLRPAQFPPQCNSPPINGQCSNFISFDVAL